MIKTMKFLSLGTLVLIAILAISHLVWKSSGSNQWELEIDKDGVKVYALKSPGSSMKQFKGVTRVKTTMNRVVAAMMDTDIQNCAEWVPGCVDGKSVESWNSQGMYYIHFYHVNYPRPFSPREFLLKTQFTQDVQSKVVLVEFIAVPDKLPKTDSCFRVEHMHNRWRYTPLENGEIEVEYIGDMDVGIPYYLFNYGAPRTIHKLLSALPRLMNKEKYQHADYAFIKS